MLCLSSATVAVEKMDMYEYTNSTNHISTLNLNTNQLHGVYHSASITVVFTSCCKEWLKSNLGRFYSKLKSNCPYNALSYVIQS